MMRFFLSVLLIGLVSAPAMAQTFTYHLHQESSTRAGLLQLKSTGPDTATKLWTQGPSVGQTTYVRVFDLPAGIPSIGGVIPKGTTLTFTLWMRITAARGTVYPAAALLTNWPSDAPTQELCHVQGTTALTTTLAPYTLTCTVQAPLVLLATDRLTLFPEFYTSTYTPGNGKNGTMSIEMGAEGTLNGSADSRFVMAIPPDPRISSVTPTAGGAGTTITVSGANFGATQGSSQITINTLDVAPISWSGTQIVAAVPDGVSSGPVQVRVNNLPSNPWMFIGTWDSMACQPLLSSSQLRITTANGGSTTVNVTADPSCQWNVQSLPSWLTANPMSGTGNATVSLTASTNSSNEARTEDFSINNVPVALLQNGQVGAPLFWVKTLPPAVVTDLDGTATCSLDVNSDSTATPMFVGMTLYLGTERVAVNRNAGSAFTLQASASVPVGYGSFLSCLVYSIGDGFVVSEGTENSTGPRISSINPSVGLPGSVVTITGVNFGATEDISLVAFDTIYATPTSWSANAIVVPVPAGATSGPVRVVVAGQVSNGAYYEDLSATQVCVPQLSPDHLTYPAAGGASSLTLSADPACAWSISALPTWLAADVTSGVGPATVTLTAQALPNSDPRGAAFSVNGVPADAVQNTPTAFVTTATTTSNYGDILLQSGVLACTGFVNTGNRYKFLYSGLAIKLDGIVLGTTAGNGYSYTLNLARMYSAAPYDRVATCTAYTVPEGRIIWQKSLQVPGSPTSCAANTPRIMNKGYRPDTTVTYQFTNSGWTATERSCVVDAINNWSAANSATGLNVTFTPYQAGQGPPPGLTLIKSYLGQRTAGGTSFARDAEGFVTAAGTTFTTNKNLLESCIGFRKVGLHELGHGMGLDDNTGTSPTTVMNMFVLKDDSTGQVASQVTSCDASQAFQAQFHP